MAIREYSPTLSKTDTGCFRQQIEEPYEFVKVDRVFEELAGLRYAPFVRARGGDFQVGGLMRTR